MNTQLSYIVRAGSSGSTVVRVEETGDLRTETEIAKYENTADAWQTRAVLAIEVRRYVACPGHVVNS